MIIVAGASGKTGSSVASKLLDAGKRVRVLLRREDTAEAWRARGAEVQVGSLDDARFLRSALEGASALYALIPEDMRRSALRTYRLQIVEALASAVRSSSIPHVVLLSAAAAVVAEGNGPAAELHIAEQALGAATTRLTTLRPCAFQENALSVLPTAITDGVYPNFLPSADFAVPMIAARDVATYAVDRLIGASDPSEVLDLSGPSYSARQVAALLSEALAKPIRVVHIPADQHVAALTRAGLSPEFARSVAELYACFASGRIQARGDRSLTGATQLTDTLRAALSRTVVPPTTALESQAEVL
jgi:uncharacterized protein YbjT (DUF2867 family)